MGFDFLSAFGWGNAPLLMVIGTIISLIITVIIYMFSVMLQHTKWQAFAKKEIGQVFLNLLLFWLIFLMIGMLLGPNGVVEKIIVFFIPESDAANYGSLEQAWDNGAVWDSATHQCLITKPWVDGKRIQYPIHSCIAMKHLNDLAGINLDTMEYILFTGGAYVVFQNIEIKIGPYQQGWGCYPGAGFNTLTAQMQEMFNILMVSYVLVVLQYFIIDFTSQVMFPVFLIVGMVLRNFYLTRRLGGFIAAVALAMFFVLPLIYVLNYALFMSEDMRPAYAAISDVKGSKGRLSFHNIYGGDPKIVQIFGSFDQGLKDIDDDYDPAKIEMFNDNKRQNFWQNAIESISKTITAAGRLITESVDSYLKLMYFLIFYPILLVGKIIKVITFQTATDLAKGHGIGAFMVDYGGWIHMVARIFVYVIVSPLLALYAVIASLKSLSQLLGGESQILGLSYFL